jgi:hypothetical protein
MGFSFRKVLGLGPFRMSLSRSGVGVSAGVRGMRVSAGPRGTYVTFSGGGFQYRRRIDTSGGVPRSTPARYAPASTTPDAGFISNASVDALAQLSPDDVILDVQRRLNAINWFAGYVLFASVVWVFAILIRLAGAPWWFAMPLPLLLIVLSVPIFRWNYERRTARLLYDVSNPEILARAEMCIGAAQWLSRSQALWYVYHQMATSDRKHNAGASSLIRRARTWCAPTSLPRVVVNLNAGCIPVGPQQLLFLPDRLLVVQGGRIAGLGYEYLDVDFEPTRFIEEGLVPRDAECIDYTWRYTNKSGGPDRRFSKNHQIPILRYGELHLHSPYGINTVLQCSSVAAAAGAADAFKALIGRARSATVATSTSEGAEGVFGFVGPTPLAWPILLASFAGVLTLALGTVSRESSRASVEPPRPVATPPREMTPSLPTTSATAATTIGPPRCGSPQHAPKKQLSAAWTKYACLNPDDASAFECLSWSDYTDKPGFGCPGAQMCCVRSDSRDQ